MKAKNCLIFGGTGQIGTNLIRKLVKKNYKVTVVTRNLHAKGNFVKTQANVGYINIVEKNLFDLNDIESLFIEADICINLVGILFEKGKNTFKNIHYYFPKMLASLCNKHDLEQFIHISALGLDDVQDSNYALSKKMGEKAIREIFNKTTILRPSIVYSVDDNFTTTFMTLLRRLPFFPIYYNGDTKFMPIHCSDLTDVIEKIIYDEIKFEIIECGGPQVMSFKEILLDLMELIEKKRILIPTPLIFGKFIAGIFELTPKPILTSDQLRLLKYNNVYSNKFKTNSSIGVPSKKIFKSEVKKYCYMWKDGGQYSTEKYLNKETN